MYVFNMYSTCCTPLTLPSNNTPHLPTLSTACTSTVWSSSNLTTAVWPAWLAKWRAVLPHCGYEEDRRSTHTQCLTTGPVEGRVANTLWVCITSGVFAYGIHGVIDMPMNAQFMDMCGHMALCIPHPLHVCSTEQSHMYIHLLQYYMSFCTNSSHSTYHQMYITLTQSCLLGSAPLSNNSCIVSWWPFSLAIWRALCCGYCDKYQYREPSILTCIHVCIQHVQYIVYTSHSTIPKCTHMYIHAQHHTVLCVTCQ